MTPERWQQVDQLFHSALERAPKERVAFLDQACGADAALRREVESLLAADAATENTTQPLPAQVAAEMLAAEHAPTLIGSRLSHYQILSHLGRGGMGEVYLATDTQLGRKVAIKLLPAAFTTAAERVRRFRQEARAASALNHPNILTIHEISEADHQHFIVSEYVAGETLRRRLASGPLALHAALDIALQAASALEAAHASGIIHRDIKPENLMVRPDGLVKVLDFGLAKLTERPAVADNSDALTLARAETEPGVVMGTVSYMSPEQARGQKVDARTDIFSLGVVLYEMVAGHAPFAGATPSDVMAAILTTEPEQLSRLAPEVPPELERIVTKVLRKDREERYQTVKDLLVDLKDLKQDLEINAKLARADQGEAVARTHTTSSAEYLVSEIKRHKRSVILALATLIVVGAGIAYWLSQLLGQQKPAAPFQTMEIRRLTHTGKARRAAIAPDGKYVAHVMEEAGRQSLWLRHVATNSDTQIVAPAEVDYRSITFSPDGNFLYYVRGEPRDPAGGPLAADGTLYQATVLGKDEKKLIEKVNGAVTFSPEGNRLAFVRWYPGKARSALIVANVDGADEKELATDKAEKRFRDGGLAWSPDGTIIACATENYTPVVYRNVIGVRVADGVEIPLTSHRWDGVITGVAWLPDGSGLLVIGAERFNGLKQLWRLSWPGDKAQKLTNDLSDYEGLSLTADSGTLATAQSDRQVNIWIVPGGDASRAKQLTSGAGRADGTRSLVWTPDGKIVYRSLAGGGPNIWIMEADGTGNKLLSFKDPHNGDPAVSPDGRHIVWIASPKGVRNIWRMEIDGGNPKQVTNGSGEWHPQYSPDGKWIVYSGHQSLLWKIPVDGGKPVQLTTGLSWRPSISPDGKLIAFNRQDEASGQYKIAVMSIEGGEPIKVFDILGGSFRPIVWMPDGRAVSYPVTRGGVSNIWAQPLDGSPAKQLTDFRDGLIFDFAWSRDGKQLALSRGLTSSDVVLLSNFK